MKLLFFYTNNSSQCAAILRQIPTWVQCVDCFENVAEANKYKIQSVPVWIVIDSDSNEVARINSVNIDAVIQWYRSLKETKNDTNV